MTDTEDTNGTETASHAEEGSSAESVENENPILFYCRSCKKLVPEPVRKGSSYEYSCPECKEDRVAFGTQKAICDFFQVTPPRKNA